MTTRANTGEQLREVAAALKQDQRNYLHEVMQGQKRIEELEAELAKAHEYGYQYRQERNRAEAELATLKAQEPIGWYTDDHLTDKSATTYDRAIAERWDEKGWQLWPLYAAPAQPQSDAVMVPRKLLERSVSLLCSYSSTLQDRSVVRANISELRALLGGEA